MKLFRLLPFLLLLSAAASAQSGPYGNEWIDYNATYYKFKVGTNGIYRISKSALDAAGVPATVTGNSFKLYRYGQEVPIYTSATGTFGSSDYIEFYGLKADGAIDEELYNTGQQLNDRISLFGDTAAYFLTYDGAVGHLRYTQITNTIPPSPTPVGAVLAKSIANYSSFFAPGKTCAPGYQFFASLFGDGEGYVNSLTDVSTSVPVSINLPNVVNSGNATFNAGISGLSYQNVHSVRAYVNNQVVSDVSYGVHETKRFHNINIAASLIASGTASIKFEHYNIPACPNPPCYDRYGISFVEIEYPRNSDLSGLDYFEFRLPYSSTAQYLEFTGFNAGSGARLYDVTNKKWYAADQSIANQTRFYVAGSTTIATRSFVLYGSNSNAIKQIGSTKTIHFTDYSQAAKQGNYVIVAHPGYMQITNGRNYVDDYKTYRASATGGSHHPVIADVTELYDEFAYGIDIHPLSVKHFMKYASDNWSDKPKNLFLIGRGVLYNTYNQYLASPSSYPYYITPTFGNPGSDVDFINWLPNYKMAMNVGRLSAWTPAEVGDYLNKVKQYEAALPPAAIPTLATEGWKKRVLHLAGSSNKTEQQTILLPTLNLGRDVIEDSLYGGKVMTLAKDNTSTVSNIDSKSVDSIINNGLSIITFHGHGSSGSFDFNLNDPAHYKTLPKLPQFIGLGCDIAQIFDLTDKKTLSEKYIATPDGGSINMIASSNLGFTNFHRSYLLAYYHYAGRDDYGGTFGDMFRHANDSVLNISSGDFYLAHLESMFLQADPAIRTYGSTRPDFHITADAMYPVPANVNTDLDSFKLKIVAFNLSRTSEDTITIKVEHINPAGAVTTVSSYKVQRLYYSDTTLVNIPIDKVKDLGLNKYRVTIDADNKVTEVSEANNVGTLELFIYSDNLIPVYPYEFSIVNKQNITLKASSLNPFRPGGRFRLEIDTTENFNSSIKQQTTVTTASGVIKWTPSMTYTDSTVYYWRAAFDSVVAGKYQWSNSSFIYLSQGSEGWNQSHYFQYDKDLFDSLSLKDDRMFHFDEKSCHVKIFNTVMTDPNNNGGNHNNVAINEVIRQLSGCNFNLSPENIQIMIFDTVTGQPLINADSVIFGANAKPPCNLNNRGKYAFEFETNSPARRNDARRMIDSLLPDGYYILIKSCINDPNKNLNVSTINDWINDTAIYHNNLSLYYSLKNVGFTMVDSLYSKRAYIYMFRKNRPDFTPYQEVTTKNGYLSDEYLEKDYYLPVLGNKGNMLSTVVGPAKEWKTLKWKQHTPDAFPQNDSTYVQVIGIDTLGAETVLYSDTTKEVSLAAVNPVQYPKMKLHWFSKDIKSYNTAQLDYWRILYTPVPEAALNPGIRFVYNDSVQVGQQIDFSVGIENLTDIPMDSMLVKYRLIDANGVSHLIGAKRYKPLAANDTLHASISFDPSGYPGSNNFFIEANPDNDQREQYHPNNLGYLGLKVMTDLQNPLLDVTFDGVHILNKDIVSAKPFIKIGLKDENKYRALDDTSLLELYLRHPKDPKTTKRKISFDGKVCKFVPAQQGATKNEAYIEYRPVFTEDSTYDLIVSAKDKAGNDAGGAAKTDYEISFTIYNKPAITHVLNYPNPFSTSTAFVFTLTGSQIPSQFKIQIMTVTGKVVREITRAELGALHIGRNITEYKWDGRDEYGQMLGNGVYLYRVVTTINGNNLDQWKTASGAEEKFFNQGWGKMYIMR